MAFLSLPERDWEVLCQPSADEGPQGGLFAVALQSLYDVLKEKEVQLQELQRLLNEAQTVLSRVLDLDAVVAGSARAAQESGHALGNSGSPGSAKDRSPNNWGANGSTEFP